MYVWCGFLWNTIIYMSDLIQLTFKREDYNGFIVLLWFAFFVVGGRVLTWEAYVFKNHMSRDYLYVENHLWPFFYVLDFHMCIACIVFLHFNVAPIPLHYYSVLRIGSYTIATDYIWVLLKRWGFRFPIRQVVKRERCRQGRIWQYCSAFSSCIFKVNSRKRREMCWGSAVGSYARGGVGREILDMGCLLRRGLWEWWT